MADTSAFDPTGENPFHLLDAWMAEAKKQKSMTPMQLHWRRFLMMAGHLFGWF